MLIRKYLEDDFVRLSLWAPVALGTGIALYFTSPSMPGIWFLPLLLVLMLPLVVMAKRATVHRWPFIALLLLLAGMGLADVAARFDGTPMLARDSGVRLVTGVIRDIEPQERGSRLIIDVAEIEKLAPAETPLRVRIAYRLKTAPPAIGSSVTCAAKLMAISPPVIPGGYDFRRHNYFNHIGATGFAVAECTVLADAGQSSAISHITSTGRLHVRTSVDAVLDGDQAAITEALLTGVQQGITDPTMDAMRVSGLVHILSVSGLHIGLAAGIVFFVLRALLALVPLVALRWPIKKIAAVAALLSAIAYTLLVGAPIPAVRSLLMTALMLLAVLLDRQALTLRVVAVAALGVLILYPASVLSPSFQMSFAAVTAIIALIESTENWRLRWLDQQNIAMRIVVYVLATVATSLAATLATLPFTYYHFQQLNVYGVIANMLAMPLASFWLMPLAVITFIALPFGLQHYPLLLMGQGVEWLIDIATSVAAMPGADWRAPHLPDAALALMAFGGLWLLLWRARWRWWGLGPIALACIMGFFTPLPQAIISDDGKLAMLQQGPDDYVLVAEKRVRDDNFVVEQWSRYLGVRNITKSEGSTLCDESSCATENVLLIRDPNMLAEICSEPDARVTLLPSAGASRNCNVALDTWRLYREGAALVSHNGKIETVAQHVGNWPWSRFVRRP